MKLLALEDGDYIWFDDDGNPLMTNNKELLKIKLKDAYYLDEEECSEKKD